MKDRRRSVAFSRIPAIFWAAIVVLASSEASPAGQYRLAPGDTVEVSVGGVPDQRNRVQIQIDGTIALPGVGTVEVAGLTPAELQSRMETLLQSRILRHRSAMGASRPSLSSRATLLQASWNTGRSMSPVTS